MIQVKSLYKSFEGKDVLVDINATFNNGKTNLIIGQSGSGKTVLMKCIVGLLTPEKGEILYDGRNFLNMHYLLISWQVKNNVHSSLPEFPS